jgi:hypothetical protein
MVLVGRSRSWSGGGGLWCGVSALLGVAETAGPVLFVVFLGGGVS